jgi:Ni,Fe-hydrogenase I small subunit
MESVHRAVIIEDLIQKHPLTVGYMIRKGLPCFVCGEPTWGTFEEMARRSGKSDEQIDQMIGEINVLVEGK